MWSCQLVLLYQVSCTSKKAWIDNVPNEKKEPCQPKEYVVNIYNIIIMKSMYKTFTSKMMDHGYVGLLHKKKRNKLNKSKTKKK